MVRVKNLASAIMGEISNTAKSVLDLVGLTGTFRKVRVELEGSGRLEMREVRVYDENNVNKARSGTGYTTTATQSSTYATYLPSRAVDNNDSQDHGSRTLAQEGK